MHYNFGIFSQSEKGSKAMYTILNWGIIPTKICIPKSLEGTVDSFILVGINFRALRKTSIFMDFMISWFCQFVHTKNL